MKKYIIEFCKRGLLIGGFGPIIAGIIYLILSYTIKDFTLSGLEVFVAIISTYLLAFISAGASIFNQIENWPPLKSLLIHMATLYVAYVTCYLVNTWIPFDYKIVLIFTGIFIAGYLVIYLIVYLTIMAVQKKLNKNLKKVIK